MSRNLSATGWSAGGTLLAALVGSAAGVAVAAAGGEAVVVAAVSALGASAAGAVTTSAGLVAGFSDALTSDVLVSVLVASGTEAVASSLKSLAVGGGTLAGSGRGTAASIASSAALFRGGSLWASAEVADTVRKVAATAISTRSNPARFFRQSRIVTPLAKPPRYGTAHAIIHLKLSLKRRLDLSLSALNVIGSRR